MIRCDHLIPGEKMVKCTESRVPKLKTVPRWKSFSLGGACFGLAESLILLSGIDSELPPWALPSRVFRESRALRRSSTTFPSRRFARAVARGPAHFTATRPSAVSP